MTLSISAADSAAQLFSLTSFVESWAKIIGILAAGVWTYLIFVRQRQRYPRATIVQEVLYQQLPIERTLLVVSVSLANIGTTLIEVDYIEVVVARLSPLKKSLISLAVEGHDPLDSAARREFLWYRIAHRRTGFKTGHLEIEPGESEQVNFDFAVSGDLEQIKVGVHVENVFKRHTLRDWLREQLPNLPMVTIRSANRCIGWGCISYYQLASKRTLLTRAVIPSHLEAGYAGTGQEQRPAVAGE